MLDVCPMCGHGKKYVPTHIATMDEINRQVFATRPDGGDSLTTQELKAEGLAFAKINYIGLSTSSSTLITAQELLEAMEKTEYKTPFTSALAAKDGE